MTVQRSGAMEAYATSLQEGLFSALLTATRARAVGIDPRTEPEIPVASDLADRVEALLGIAGVAGVSGTRSRDVAGGGRTPDR